MTLLYASVGYKGSVLVEHYVDHGNFVDTARTLLTKIPAYAKKSYSVGGHNFHYISENELVFLCFCHEKLGFSTPFDFLMDIQSRFIASYGHNLPFNAPPATYDPFGRVLEERMRYFSNPQSNKINMIKDQVSVVKDELTTTLEKTMNRGGKIEIIVDKTERLQAESFQFKSGATQLKRKLWWQNKKMMIIIFVIVFYSRNHRSSTNKTNKQQYNIIKC
ncbi:vesicle-associated membrane protein 7 [Heterostelium album PN500]|uniref:Vesicle-associated membrane protein 7 n=1 Tax=Heterostelium pallidum (strain ATCC 26659 / Pp 5 / PN500) TaxID=670386 RepID=D3BV49_HETP5|nr:vesicle-associated membrane protein 7 [Heterostelium album PN500]EFA74987.1 vesicle-associated membrane protein 7 [Heterostelium album PN500]|eukprot:XP_020427121.1 vesicle-associated membrane protein 7 [Heterostelium album PN500]